MVSKYVRVAEDDYNCLLKPPLQAPHLYNSRLSDDIKAILYQNDLRNTINKSNEIKKVPIIVRNVPEAAKTAQVVASSQETPIS